MSTARRSADDPDRRLLESTHPPGYVNPEPAPRYNLVVIGAGTAGLVTAAGAAGLGAKVALVERDRMGGDCLNVGCVPSKAMIRCARLLGEIRRANEFGVRGVERAEADFAAVMERMRRVRAEPNRPRPCRLSSCAGSRNGSVTSSPATAST